MPRVMKWRRDGTSDAPKPIDIRLPGLGTPGDRLQITSGVLHKTAYTLRVNMIRECWALGGMWADAVRALARRRFDVNALYDAKQQGGEAGVRELLERAGAEPLADVIRDYLAGTRATDLRMMRQRLDRFREYLGGDSASVADVTAANVDAFLSQLTDQRTTDARPAQGSTVNRYRAVIGGMCTWAIRNGRMREHPIAGKKVEKRPEPHHRLPELSADEYRDYMAHVQGSRPDLAVVLLLLIHTAPDVGELLARTVRDVDLEDGKITYQRTKTKRFESTNKPRKVPMPTVVVEELRAHIAEHELRGSQLLFDMFRRSDIESTHARAAKAIQRPELTLKDLRHVAAIAWVKAGVHIRLVQRWLGHGTLTQTMKYTDYEPDAEAANEMAERAAETLNKTVGVTPISGHRQEGVG